MINFKKIKVFDIENKKMKIVDFFKSNLIIGFNSMGKSLLMSLIYHCFGIETNLQDFNDVKDKHEVILYMEVNKKNLYLKRKMINKNKSNYYLCDLDNDVITQFPTKQELEKFFFNNILKTKDFLVEQNKDVNIVEPSFEELFSFSTIPQWSWGDYRVFHSFDYSLYKKEKMNQYLINLTDNWEKYLSDKNVDFDLVLQNYKSYKEAKAESRLIKKVINKRIALENFDFSSIEDIISKKNELENSIKLISKRIKEIRMEKNDILNKIRENKYIDYYINSKEVLIKCEKCENLVNNTLAEILKTDNSRFSLLINNNFFNNDGEELFEEKEKIEQKLRLVLEEYKNFDEEKKIVLGISELVNMEKKISPEEQEAKKYIDEIFKVIEKEANLKISDINKQINLYYKEKFKISFKESEDKFFMRKSHGVSTIIFHILRSYFLHKNIDEKFKTPVVIDGYQDEVDAENLHKITDLFENIKNEVNQILVFTVLNEENQKYVDSLINEFDNVIFLENSSMLVSDELDYNELV